MNVQALLFAAAVALVNPVSADEACSTDQASSAFLSLSSLLSGPDLTTCSSDSGYNMITSPSLPTAEMTAKMCTSTACHSLIATIISKKPPNCLLTVPTSGAVINVYTLATTFEAGCTAATTTPAATAAAPAAPTTPTATAVTPTATTVTPAATTATPAATTATPSATTTPTPSSSKTAC